MISIIVPIYNVEKYLKQCLDSILSQTYDDYEIILVDDGATDDCPKICDEYALSNSKIRVIHKQNGGLVSAWMAGVNVCKGEYICFIDSDDFIGKDYLSKLYNALINNNADLSAMSCIRYYNEVTNNKWRINTLEQGTYRIADYRDRIICDYGNFNRIVSNSRWGKLIKTDLVKKAMVSCTEQISYGEDQQLTIGILVRANNVAIVDDYDYFYRYNPNSIVNSYREDNWEKIKLLMSVISNIPDIRTIPNFQEQYNTLLILYANNLVKEEFIHKRANNSDKIKLVVNDKELRLAFKQYYSKNMGRYDSLMTKAVKSRSLCRIKMVMEIYKLYCKIKGINL